MPSSASGIGSWAVSATHAKVFKNSFSFAAWVTNDDPQPLSAYGPAKCSSSPNDTARAEPGEIVARSKSSEFGPFELVASWVTPLSRFLNEQFQPVANVAPTGPKGPFITGVALPGVVTFAMFSPAQSLLSAMKVRPSFWNEMKPTPPSA